jgi:hypothetical protein
MLQVADIAGIRAVAVHAKDDEVPSDPQKTRSLRFGVEGSGDVCAPTRHPPLNLPRPRSDAGGAKKRTFSQTALFRLLGSQKWFRL